MNTKAVTNLPEIPRDAWKSHKNYPHQVLLLGSHDNFRKVSNQLVQAAWGQWSAAPKGEPSDHLRRYFTQWKRAMKNHEGYEEGKLYPFLERRYGTSLSFLEKQHEQLGNLDKAVHKAFSAGDTLKFAHALKNHDALLSRHLKEEEEAVIPLLLSLDRDEFTRYANGG